MADASSKNDFLEPPRQTGELGRLGPYRVLSIIGSGGMGRVFLAQDTRLQRDIALKVMNERFAATPNSRHRFLDEARAMAAIDSDYVVRIYEVGQHNQTPFMAMELLEGESLEDRNASKPKFSPSELIQLACQLCDGLAAAHARGIIHRDIKPANIWLEVPSGRPKILDFGLALAGAPAAQLTGRGSVVGTPGYLSPEQARNERLDDRSDLYSLGVVLFELCTGRLPFEEKVVPMMLIAIIAHQTPSPLDFNPNIPLPLAELIERMLSKEARDRPASAAELKQELLAVQESLLSESQAALRIVTDSEITKTGSSLNRAKSRPERVPLKWLASPVALSIIGGSFLTVLLVILGLKVLYPAVDIPATDNQGRSSAVAAPKSLPPLLPGQLAALQLQQARLLETEIGVGDLGEVTFDIVNQAVGREDDPVRLYADRPTLVACQLYLASQNGIRRDGYAMPLRRRPSQLPQPGKKTSCTIHFETATIPVGLYQAIVALETPRGSVIHEVALPLRLVPNLRSEPLDGYEIVRTWTGDGADTTVGKKSEKDLGVAKSLILAGTADDSADKQQLIFLKFDLRRIEGLEKRMRHVVLTLTLAEPSPQEMFAVRAYAVRDRIADDWKESGEGRLDLENASMVDGFGELDFLGTSKGDNTGGVLSGQVDSVRLFGAELDDAVRSAGDFLTLVFVAAHTPSKPLQFVAKESDPEKAPALALKLEAESL
ncbi:serine/threonine-protein kinase [Roseimaritima multifibrata]|nr:serine/threonine-protein kinase [Roseimaritima multifibrata]